MNADKTSVVTGPTVVAIAQEEDRLKAVMLRKQDTAFEVLWTKSSDAGQADWRPFAAECDLSAERTGVGENRVVVVGFDSTGVVFYRLNVPAVKEEEIAAMVRLQAETRLPLPVEQMGLAWRVGRVKDGQVAVTVAAARKEQLEGFVENVRGFEPAKILLACEGTVKAWRAFFSGSGRKAVVVSIGSRNTQVCLAEGGQLSNAVSLDMGMEDFSAAQASAEQTETAERFAQDMRSILELFGCAEPAKLPVFVLSDGSSVIETTISYLRSAGLNAEAAVAQIQKLKAEAKLGVKDAYEYRVPIGLGLMALDGDAEELNIFERLYNPAGEGEKKRWFYSLRVAGAIAAVMLAVLVIVSYAVDVAKLNAIEKQLRGTESEINCGLLMERQKLIKVVAQQRPDLLGLLSEINSDDNKAIKLDRLDFKKGRPVSISGQADGAEQLYKFQKSLLTKKGITEVMIQNASEDGKTKKLKFTITFHYKNFTRKKGRSLI